MYHICYLLSRVSFGQRTDELNICIWYACLTQVSATQISIAKISSVKIDIAEISIMKVNSAQVRNFLTLLSFPGVPGNCSLHEQFKMLWISHSIYLLWCS